MLKLTFRICLICIVLLSTTFFFNQVIAQVRCETDIKMEEHFEMDPAFMKAHMKEISKKPSSAKQKSGQQDIITIPVHVIIVHPPGQNVGTGDNLSLEHIMSQIDVLNEDFRLLNADADETPDEFPTADCMIEFCLAAFDESGDETDGVTRYATNDDFDDNEFAIKQATGWDRDDYMNIWVAPTIDALGYAYLPTPTSLPNATLDGLAIRTGTFGGPGYADLPPYDLGRTSTHETGHYLGLRHVWGNGGCASDDNISDTPMATEEYYGCPNHPSPSCGSNDMFMNYMDYVNDACMHAFTPGQSDYMNNILNTSRSSLLTAADEKCEGDVPELSGEILSQTNISCFGETDGAVTVTGIDGVPPYEYSIDGGPYTPNSTFLNLAAGTYTITVRDDVQQTFDISVTITEPQLLQIIEISHTDISCFGEDDGSVVVTGVGGTNNQPYEYAIDGGLFGFNNVFLNLTPGVHVVTVRDDNNCMANLNVFINEPGEISVSVDEDDINDVSCFGGNDGTATLTISGGTPPFSIVLDGNIPQDDVEIEDLEAGDHTITVVDINGCGANTAFTISQPDSLLAILTGKMDLTCFGDSSGMISLYGMGGLPEYSFKIGDGDYQSDSVFLELPAGKHTLTVKDINGCEASTSETLTQPDEVGLALDSETPPDCFGSANGTIQVVANGGIEPYSYALGTELNNDGIFEGLASGSYTITVMDQNDCQSSLVHDLSQPDEVVLAIVSQTEAGCDGLAIGTVQLQAQGGTGNFIYRLDGDPNNTGFFDELISGTYSANATDENGCIAAIDVTIEEPNNFNFEIVSMENVLCYGEDEGNITVLASGGANNYTYSLDGTNYSSNNLFKDLFAGDYTVYAKDENNCKQEIIFEITQPDELYIDLLGYTDIICFDDPFGEVVADFVGGVLPYDISFNGKSINEEDLIDNALVGQNELLLIDANGCMDVMNIEIERADALEVITKLITDIPCGGGAVGEIDIDASGGVPPYTYYLDNVVSNDGIYTNLSEGNYEILIIDALNCAINGNLALEEGVELGISNENKKDISCFNANDGTYDVTALGGDGDYTYELVGVESNNSGMFSNLSPGSYDVNIVDGGGCFTMTDFEINEPSELTLVNFETSDDTGSGNGSAEVMVEGGTPPYMYSINGSSFGPDNSFIGLSHGDYDIIAKDFNDCEILIQISIGLSSSIIDLEFISGLKLFPNPVFDQLYLEIESLANQELEIKIRSIDGKIISTSKRMIIEGINVLEVDQHNLASGLYLMEIRNEKGSSQLKFVKQD